MEQYVNDVEKQRAIANGSAGKLGDGSVGSYVAYAMEGIRGLAETREKALIQAREYLKSVNQSHRGIYCQLIERDKRPIISDVIYLQLMNIYSQLGSDYQITITKFNNNDVEIIGDLTTKQIEVYFMMPGYSYLMGRHKSIDDLAEKIKRLRRVYNKWDGISVNKETEIVYDSATSHVVIGYYKLI
jgi:hypothetical protein